MLPLTSEPVIWNGTLTKFVASPVKEPVNDPVLYDDVNKFKELVDDSMEFNLNS